MVEDEPRLASVVERAMHREGWSVDVVGTGTDALWQATEFEYDVIALDVGIPAPDGFEVCRILRDRKVWTPILFLTARNHVADRVEGLDSGADDYLTKPFALEELAARLRALGRRSLGARPTQLGGGDLSMNVSNRSVTRNGAVVDLSTKEFAVLELLLRRPGDVVTRSTILEHAWDSVYDGASNVIDVYVARLRDKIDRPFGRRSIETVRGAGYRFNHNDQ